MFLKNKNIIFKIRRSKVTDYAALRRINDVAAILFQRWKRHKTNADCRMLIGWCVCGGEGGAVKNESATYHLQREHKCAPIR